MSYTEITSRKNQTIIYSCKLYNDKKARDQDNMFVFEGIKLLGEAVLSGLDILRIFFTKDALDKYSSMIEETECREKYLVTDEVYAKLSGESSPQGIFTCAKKPFPHKFDCEAISGGAFVFLEDIQNPQNIGAILRCCYSMGFEKIVFSDKCADIYSPKCARAAMGSLFKIKPFFSNNLPFDVKNLVSSGKRVFCTMLSGESKMLGKLSFLPDDSFVIGNEGHGASEDLQKECTCGLYIPMNEGAESLNAATAAAIVMWEMKKDILCGNID